MKKLLIVVVMLLDLMGCQKPIPTLEITTSISPLKNLITAQVSGVEVESLLPNGQDFHHYEPSASDLSRVYQSQLFICLGEGYEPFVSTIKANKPANLELIELVNEPLVQDTLIKGDPHFWYAPKTTTQLYQSITNILIEHGFQVLNRENADLDAIIKRYEALKTTIDTTPIIVDHDGLSYLALDYDVDVINIYGKNEEQEPSSSDISRIISTITRDGVKTIYYIDGGHEKIMNVIHEQTGCVVKRLHNPLVSDDLATMIKLWEDNYQLLVLA